MDKEKVIVIDFGGQYNQLVARRVRECNVYCEIYSYRTGIEEIKAMAPKGIILTGGPNSCYEEDSPTYSKELFELGIPVLGLCYGAQLMMHVLGGKVITPEVGEYGKTEINFTENSVLQKDLPKKSICWMSHFDRIAEAAPGFEVTASTADCPIAAAQNVSKNLYAIQFHPEVLHTENGTKMIYNFVREVCGCAGTWRMDSFVKESIEEIRNKVGDGKVLLALSGGVDSSVAAGLLSRAIGKQLTCVFVDHGLLRKDEGDEVENVFGPNGQFDLNFIRVNAQQRYYDKLAGVTEPEQKRKIIGEEFIRVFEEEAKKIGSEIMKSVEEMKANGNVLIVSPALKVAEKNGKQEEQAAVPVKKAKQKMKEDDELKKEIEQRTAELQNCLAELERKKKLSENRVQFIDVMDKLEKAEDELSQEEDFNTVLYKLKFCQGNSYRDDDTFSISNRLIIVEFIHFILLSKLI